MTPIWQLNPLERTLERFINPANMVNRLQGVMNETPTEDVSIVFYEKSFYGFCKAANTAEISWRIRSFLVTSD